jgi:DNA-directed RNA polymerase alpha subunit
VDLKIPARILTCLDDRKIHTIKDLKRLTVKELQKIKNLGPVLVNDTIAILKKAGITLQEENKETNKKESSAAGA